MATSISKRMRARSRRSAVPSSPSTGWVPVGDLGLLTTSTNNGQRSVWFSLVPGENLDHNDGAAARFEAGISDVFGVISSLGGSGSKLNPRKGLLPCHVLLIDAPTSVAPKPGISSDLMLGHIRSLGAYQRVSAIGIDVDSDHDAGVVTREFGRLRDNGLIRLLSDHEALILRAWTAGRTLHHRVDATFGDSSANVNGHVYAIGQLERISSGGADPSDIRDITVPSDFSLLAARVMRSDARCFSARFLVEQGDTTLRLLSQHKSSLNKSLAEAKRGEDRKRLIQEVEVTSEAIDAVTAMHSATLVAMTVTGVWATTGEALASRLNQLPGKWIAVRHRSAIKSVLRSCHAGAMASTRGRKFTTTAQLLQRGGLGHHAIGGDSMGRLGILGLTMADRQPVWMNLHPNDRAGSDARPLQIVLAGSGGGKTMTLQAILADYRAQVVRSVMINMKEGDTREPFFRQLAELMPVSDAQYAAAGYTKPLQSVQVISFSSLTGQDGPIDPLRMLAIEPSERVELAKMWVRLVCTELAPDTAGRTIAEAWEQDLDDALREAVESGRPTCLGEVMETEALWQNQSRRLAFATFFAKTGRNPLIAACYGRNPASEALVFGEALSTLIEPGAIKITENADMAAALMLVLSSAITSMRDRTNQGGLPGGQVIMDEAHVMVRLGGGLGAKTLNTSARICRSLGVGLVLATQEAGDLIGSRIDKNGAAQGLNLDAYASGFLIGGFANQATEARDAAYALVWPHGEPLPDTGSMGVRIDSAGSVIRGSLYYCWTVEYPHPVLTEIVFPTALLATARADKTLTDEPAGLPALMPAPYAMAS